MIRKAVHADIPRLVELGRMFFDESQYGDLMDFSVESVQATMRQLIDNGAIFVADDGQIFGMLGVLDYPFYLSNARTAQELFWWVDPSKRGGGSAVRMLKAAEEWAKSRGCVSMMMIGLNNDGGKAESLYSRMSYQKRETSYVRIL